jgi:caa(3)-type oxidase subunit IV
METAMSSEETHAEHHDHTRKYVSVWALLVAALAVSLVISEFHVEVVVVVLIFTVAVAKTYLVGAHFMHIKGAPSYVKWILGTGVLCLYIAFFGILIDIVYAPPYVGR